ncbi:MAG: glycosyltransferase family 2 protein [Myxococcales bacterium]|nr:glycosyltransferase family 2 protein [Myxococcales bacterium]
MRPSLAVLVPVRDEARTLGAVLQGLLQGLPDNAELVVIDDGSRDASAEVARLRGVRVIAHEASRGYGAALKTGIAATTAPTVAIIDADGTYTPSDLLRLLSLKRPGQMVIGARRVEPSLSRRLVKLLFRLQVAASTGRWAPDLNSGLRVFDRELALELWPLLPDRFSFTTTMTLGALARDMELCFAEVGYHRRVGGSSKFALLDALRFARTVHRGCGWVRARRRQLSLRPGLESA